MKMTKNRRISGKSQNSAVIPISLVIFLFLMKKHSQKGWNSLGNIGVSAPRGAKRLGIINFMSKSENDGIMLLFQHF